MEKFTIPTEAARDYFKCIKVITDECKIRMSREGFQVSAIDPANCAMVIASMPQNPHLPQYRGEPLETGIDVSNIMVILDEMMEPETEREYGEEGIGINLETNSKGTFLVLEHGSYIEELKCYDVESIRKGPKIPLNFTTEASVRIRTKGFMRLVKKAIKVTDYLSLSLTSEGELLTLIATAGDNMDPMSFSADMPLGFKNVDICDVKSLFSLDYLHDLVEAIPSPDFELGLGNNTPCSMKFNLENGGEAQFTLSPRVDTE